MDRAFNAMKLPLGAYQFAILTPTDLGEQFTESGKHPRTILAVITSPMGEPGFTNKSVVIALSERAQEHLIAALQANLDNTPGRARELINVFHPKYGEIT